MRFLCCLCYISLFFTFGIRNVFSQENILTAGFQFKPIFANSLFTNPLSIVQEEVDFSITNNFGYCAGMIIRRGVTKRISVETGINYVKRNYKLSITENGFNGISNFTIVGYEIPVLGLIYAQLGNNLFMNTAFGFSLDVFPSSISTSDTYFEHFSERRNIFMAGLLANLGYEYRTEKYGYFYFGASYHRPLNYIYTSHINYNRNNRTINTNIEVLGSYFTLDFRYFFHEEPLRGKHKK